MKEAFLRGTSFDAVLDALVERAFFTEVFATPVLDVALVRFAIVFFATAASVTRGEAAIMIASSAENTTL
ncbi:hypothetical protein [Bryobacter aggregatus]|uniref:hypothetical protein n=1 Tax=Bryobacter aggregatus TaxID=360054 RepID=UPI001EE331A7|nr:hypothetical protein [Bryobacter aggregatus]